MTNTNPATQISAILQQALAELEKFTGPEVEAMKASGKAFFEDTVKASGPLGAQIFNLGLQAVPGLKYFAVPIEAIADPIVSGFVEKEAQAAEQSLEGAADQTTAALNAAQVGA